MSDEFILLSRLIMGVPFVIWGTMKLRGGEAKLVPVLSAMGMPDAKALAYLVGLCELVHPWLSTVDGQRSAWIVVRGDRRGRP